MNGKLASDTLTEISHVMNTKVAITLAYILSVFSASATVLVDSTFTNSTLGASGRNATNSSNLTPWFLVTSATAGNALVIDDSGVGGLGKSMQVIGGQTVYTAFSTSTIADGESITLNLSYRFTGTPGNGSETFRIALSNANAAAAITSDQSSISGTNLQQYVGYYAGLAIGANPAPSGTVLRQRDANLTTGLTSSSQSSALGSNSVGVISGNTTHSLEYSISRSGSTLSFTTKIDGSTLINGTDSTSIYTTFNALAISGVGGTVILDNIILQTVPEPATCALFGIGAAFLLYRRHRRA